MKEIIRKISINVNEFLSGNMHVLDKVKSLRGYKLSEIWSMIPLLGKLAAIVLAVFFVLLVFTYWQGIYNSASRSAYKMNKDNEFLHFLLKARDFTRGGSVRKTLTIKHPVATIGVIPGIGAGSLIIVSMVKFIMVSLMKIDAAIVLSIFNILGNASMTLIKLGLVTILFYILSFSSIWLGASGAVAAMTVFNQFFFPYKEVIKAILPYNYDKLANYILIGLLCALVIDYAFLIIITIIKFFVTLALVVYHRIDDGLFGFFKSF